MKKIILLLMLLPAVVTGQTKQCKKCKEPCTGCIASAEKEKIIINNILPALPVHHAADSLLQQTIIKKLTESESSWKPFEWILPLIVSLFALWFSIKAFGRDKSYQNVGFLSEVDKLLIEHPYLRGIYDNQLANFPPGTGMLQHVTQAEYDGKLYAYCYYLINNFEVIFKYSKKGSSNRRSWENYMVHLMRESTLFKTKVKNASVDNIFDVTYQDELKKLLALV